MSHPGTARRAHRAPRVLAALTVAVPLLLVAPAQPACACSCAQLTPTEAVSRAQTVFSGRLESVEGADGGASADPVRYHFVVDRVLKGQATDRQVVESAASSASCGLEGMEAGKDYLVMAETSGATMSASLCGGTTRLTPERLAAVEKVTGPGSTPSPAPAGTARQPAWRIPVLPLGLAVAVITGALVVWRSRRR